MLCNFFGVIGPDAFIGDIAVAHLLVASDDFAFTVKFPATEGERAGGVAILISHINSLTFSIVTIYGIRFTWNIAVACWRRYVVRQFLTRWIDGPFISNVVLFNVLLFIGPCTFQDHIGIAHGLFASNDFIVQLPTVEGVGAVDVAILVMGVDLHAVSVLAVDGVFIAFSIFTIVTWFCDGDFTAISIIDIACWHITCPFVFYGVLFVFKVDLWAVVQIDMLLVCLVMFAFVCEVGFLVGGVVGIIPTIAIDLALISFDLEGDDELAAIVTAAIFFCHGVLFVIKAGDADGLVFNGDGDTVRILRLAPLDIAIAVNAFRFHELDRGFVSDRAAPTFWKVEVLRERIGEDRFIVWVGFQSFIGDGIRDVFEDLVQFI